VLWYLRCVVLVLVATKYGYPEARLILREFIYDRVSVPGPSRAEIREDANWSAERTAGCSMGRCSCTSREAQLMFRGSEGLPPCSLCRHISFAPIFLDTSTQQTKWMSRHDSSNDPFSESLPVAHSGHPCSFSCRGTCAQSSRSAFQRRARPTKHDESLPAAPFDGYRGLGCLSWRGLCFHGH
jgi:hypothetical protein